MRCPLPVSGRPAPVRRGTATAMLALFLAMKAAGASGAVTDNLAQPSTPAQQTHAAPQQAEPFQTSEAGRQAAVQPKPPPHRIITLAPHATEILYAAGGGGQIVGTVASSDFPPAARELPRVGDGIIVNQERVIMLRPTLLVGWLRSGVALEMEALADKLGAQMIYLRPQRLRDIPADIRRMGEKLANSAGAEATANQLEARIAALEQRYAAQEPVSVFIEVGSLPLYTIGADPLLNDVLRICGAVNIYGDSGIPAPRVPVESVLVLNPQFILSSERPGRDNSEIQRRWAAHGLPAAQQGRIHLADPDALYRPGPRLISATESLCSAIHAARP